MDALSSEETREDLCASWRLAAETQPGQQLALALDAMIDAEDRAGIAKLVRDLRRSPDLCGVRAALVDLIASRCPGDTPDTLNRDAVLAELGRLRKAGALKLLNPGDLKKMLG